MIDIKIIKQNEIIPYITTKELKLRMIQLIYDSYTKGSELGFILCKNRNTNILVGNSTCEGEGNYIENCLFDFKCKKDEVIVGLFHTHVDKSPDASIRDLNNIHVMGLGIIGSLVEGTTIKIKCYERKDEYNNFVDDEIDKNMILSITDENIVYKLVNKYFNVIDIL